MFGDDFIMLKVCIVKMHSAIATAPLIDRYLRLPMCIGRARTSGIGGGP